MRYWWANQNQHAYETETVGGYLWSPRHRSDGSRNPFYDNLRLARNNDMIFAYHDSAIRSVGVVLESAREAPCPDPPPPPKPDEKLISPDTPGWLLDVAWLPLLNPLFPTQHMDLLEPLLPTAHSPLSPSGHGLQGGRLLELPQHLAIMLLQLAGGRIHTRLFHAYWKPSQLRLPLDAQPPSFLQDE